MIIPKRFVLINLDNNEVLDCFFINSIKYLKNTRPLWQEHEIRNFFVLNNPGICVNLERTFNNSDLSFNGIEAASKAVELLSEFGFAFYPKEL